MEIPDSEKQPVSSPVRLDNNVDIACSKAQICNFIAYERDPFCTEKIFIQQIRHKMVQAGSFHASAMA
ncbi:MAG: hypothetical protein M0P16_01975 [Syntrophales bacterium]|jgi:hypothetical protein|nr:hypothetical protein [Syntrophales bacterium]MCK9391507.1 hypothetical protein [Syntrophales bacterium]